MGTRTRSRRRSDGTRVATPYGIDRAFNTQQRLSDFAKDLAAVLRTTSSAQETSDTNDFLTQAFATFERADGSVDVKSLQQFIADNQGATSPKIVEVLEVFQEYLDEARDDVVGRPPVVSEGGILGFLNDIGRESGQPGYFDRLLRGEQMQSADAVRDTQELAAAVTKVADRLESVRGQLAPDLLPAGAGATAREALAQALATTPLRPAIQEEVNRLRGMLSDSFTSRQNTRILDGMTALQDLHRRISTSLGRGTNAGIEDAIRQASATDRGIRTAIDTVLQGATQNIRTLERMRDLARAASAPGFPEPLRQAVLTTLRSVPFKQQEKATYGALESIARIGKTGAVPSLLSVVAARNIGGEAGKTADTMVTETRDGINRAQQLVGQRQKIASELESLIRPLERASAVYQSGR